MRLPQSRSLVHSTLLLQVVILAVCIENSIQEHYKETLRFKKEDKHDFYKKQFIPLLTFGEKAATTNSKFDLRLVNDPVMGGESQSDFSIVPYDKDKDNEMSYLKWQGEVVDVDFLEAPGFCSIETAGFLQAKFNDISNATEILLKARSQTPTYSGFKVSFSSKFTEKPVFESFKTNFTFPKDSNEWQAIYIPIDNFSNDWSAYTGNQNTPCSPETRDVCPKTKDLAHLKQITLWAEGVSAPFDLEVFGIYAVSLQSKSVVPQ